MTSMDSRAAWHPAFMPNSASDLHTRDVYHTTRSSQDKSRQGILEEPYALDTRDAPLSQYANENHDLGNLRSTLITSSAGPGGSKMEENLSQDNDMADEYGNFALNESVHSPTEKPAREYGHASSASFARTVPRDVDWGEDDEIDMDWNMQQTQIDPFKLMDTVARTNSFPSVPPTHNPASPPFDYQLPKSQAEDIFNKTEREPDFFAEDDQNEEFFSQGIGAGEIAEYDYGKSYGGDAVDELHVETRYEEGLPLVEHGEAAKSPAEEGRDPKTSLLAGHGAENVFFSDLASGGYNGVPYPLERKSTTQVLNSIDFHPEQLARPVGLGLQGGDSSQSPLHNATGGGIAVSRSTILSQVLTDPELSGLPTAEDLAARWKAALEGDELLDDDELLDNEADPGSRAVDPASLFADDDEGFLDDDDEEEADDRKYLPQGTSPMPMPVIGNGGSSTGFNSMTSGPRPQPTSTNSRYTPQNITQATQRPTQTSSNSYAPAMPLFTDFSNQSVQSLLQYDTRFHSSAAPASSQSSSQREQPPQLQKAQSFAGKSKGGYASPYDLPMEVVKPRKRASAQPMIRGLSNPMPLGAAAPPRSSSMVSQGPPPSRGSTSSLSPPMLSSGFDQAPGKMPQAIPSAQKAKGGFFEELPVTTRSKPAGRYTPQQSPTIGGDQETFTGSGHYMPNASAMAAPLPHAQPAVSQSPLPSHGLVAPPKASPYAPLGTGPAPPPVATSKYSPAPSSRSSSGGTPPPVVTQNRYTTAPPPQSQPLSSYQGPSTSASAPPPAFPHQPRTSSPLVHFETAHNELSSSTQGHVTSDSLRLRRESSSYERATRVPSLPITQELDELTGLPSASNANLPLRDYSSQGNLSPSKRATGSYAPDQRPSYRTHEPTFKPPQRSQTQSPSRFRSSIDASTGETYQRPVSAHSQSVPRYATEKNSMTSAGAPKTRARGSSQVMNYVAPTDGREHDPLQRWRGGPVFTWGVGGTVATSFPKEVPRYGTGQTKPMIICSPGEVKIRNLKDIYALEDRLADFPGPLKGKSKKKDVVAWLTAGINVLEQENLPSTTLTSATHDDKRKEERLLLWKILRLMIDNDGVLEGNPTVNEGVRNVLTPGLDQGDGVMTAQFRTGADLSSISRAPRSTTLPEPVDPTAVDELRKHLLRGEREKAVWEAVDKRLWAHALLISNTVSRDLYKQVAQEFIQKEVKNIGENTESLAAVYEIFAGNFEESIDELVPPSARAGLQMVSTQGLSGPAKSGLDGLDRWRETLGLVLSNRSPDDNQAIIALGKLLSGYGRAEAAHICFLFARVNSVFSGVDDPYANIVLVGSDHLRQPYDFERELEPILLSEVYEYGLSLSTTSNVSFSAPHLAVYKLHHATVLAQSGQRDNALQYCEAIATSITSQVRRSPYHHALLLSALDDLSKRLKQSPKDGSSSWISKPSIDKVSGSVWAKFNKFVAGDESDAASGPGSDTGPDIGPFARIAGDTPTISRSPSQGDIYSALNSAPLAGGPPHLPPLKSTSRYAPGGPYTPPVAQDPLMSPPFGSPPHGSFGQRLSLEREASNKAALGRQADPLSRNYHDLTPASPYSPYGGPSYTLQQPVLSNEQHAPSGDNQASLQGQVAEDIPSFMGHLVPESSGYTPPSEEGYAGSSNGGYEPPSYEPGPLNDEPDSPIETKPKKKKFMDDDDDDDGYKQRPASEKPAAGKTKAEKDKEAEEVFRRVAEADAKKDTPAAPSKKGWGLGGWFAKKDTPADGPPPNKPIKAKLGEESSFVYDPELKRWVNKKGGKDEKQEAASAMPPPPKGPPRTASRSPPPSRSGPPPSRSGPPPSGPTAMAPPTRTASGPPAMETTSAPRPIGSGAPQRAVSAYSTSPLGQSPGSANLRPFGVPMTRTVSNGSAASGPPSRPTTSQSNASSIDDLLGPPMLRKSGPKKPKKGRGYVDVMGEKSSI